MKRSNNTSERLKLARSTIRTLTPQELGRPQGGMGFTPCANSLRSCDSYSSSDSELCSNME